MKHGDKFITLCEFFFAEVANPGTLIVFDIDDGTAFMPYRFLIGDPNNDDGVWVSRSDLEHLVPYDNLSDKEKFLFELSGKIPERYL